VLDSVELYDDVTRGQGADGDEPGEEALEKPVPRHEHRHAFSSARLVEHLREVSYHLREF